MAPTPPASQDNEVAAVPPIGALPTAAQVITPPKGSPDCPSPADCACVTETAAFKLRVQSLEQDKTRLAAAVTLAESRATEAEKHAATAEFEKKTALKHASERYTEKMHAMNESRRDKNALVAYEFKMRDFGIKKQREIDRLISLVQQLENEKASGSFSDGSVAKLRACEQQLAKFQSALKACHAENAQRKAAQHSSSATIEGLQGTASQLQSDLAAERTKTQTAAAGPTAEEIEARIEAVRAEAKRNMDVELQLQMNNMRQQAVAKINERVRKEREQIEAQHKEKYETQAQQVLKPLADEKRKTAALQQQLEAARKEIELGNQKLQMAARTASSMQHNSPNKKRRLDEQGNAGTVTPDRSRPPTHSLLSNGFVRTPESLADSNGDINMGGFQMPMNDGQAPNQRQKATLSSMHMRHASQLSNGSSAPATPQRVMQQQGPGFGTPPQQQIGMSPQQQNGMLFRQHLSNLTPEAQKQAIEQLAKYEIAAMTPDRRHSLEEKWTSVPPMEQQGLKQHLAAQQLRRRMQRAANGQMSAQSSPFQGQSMPQGMVSSGSPVRRMNEQSSSPIRASVQNRMVMAAQQGQVNGHMSSQSSPFQCQPMSQGMMSSGSPMRGGMNAGSMQQTPRRPQMANGQQAFSSPQEQALLARQSPQVPQQQTQMLDQLQQPMQMPVQDQQVHEQMRQFMLRNREMSKNEMQPMPQRSSPSSMPPPGFAMASPHMGQMGMPANQAGTNQDFTSSATPFDAPPSHPVQHDQANGEEISGQQEMEDVPPIIDFDVDSYMSLDVQSDGSRVAPRPAGSQLMFVENADDDWLVEDGQAIDMQGGSQMSKTPAVASNGTPQMQNANFQQVQQDTSTGTPQMQHASFQYPQQRFQAHVVDPSQLHPGNPEGFNHGHHHHDGSSTPQMVPYGMQAHPNSQASPFVNYAPASQFAPGSEMSTPATSRSTPAPGGRARSQRLTPAPDTPVEPAKVPCVRCYKNWWENTCGEGEPCDNCIADNQGHSCTRQKCVNYAPGTCVRAKRGMCPNVHENDQRYHDERFLVQQEKEGLRPKRIGTQANKKTAPTQRH